MMRAGDLNRRISILSAVDSRDVNNRPIVTWSTIATVWGSIKVDRESWLYQEGSYASKVISTITLRWQRGLQLSRANRVQYVNPGTAQIHTYTIEGVDNIAEGNVTIVLQCHEIDGVD